jgi:hypothetical protein
VNKDSSLRHDILLCKQQTLFLVPYDGQLSADAKWSLDKMDAHTVIWIGCGKFMLIMNI